MQRYIVSFLFTYYHIVFGVQSFSTLPVLIRRNTRYHLFCKNDIDVGGGSSLSYSWVNPKLNDTINQFQANIISIDFDGCGQIQLHQEPYSFIQPIHNKTREEAAGRTGVTLWSAAHVVSNYIDAQFSEGGQWSSSNWTVLELGAGLGLCSTVAAKYGINNIVSTDNDFDVLQLLKENLERNKHSEEQKIHVHSLDWMAAATDSNAEKTHPVFLELEPLGGADLILLSDVIYGATELVVSRLRIFCHVFLIAVSYLIFSLWFDVLVGISIDTPRQVLCTKKKTRQ